MRELRPLLARNDLHQVLLDLDRIRLAGETEAERHARDMGVDDDALAPAERVAKDHVRRFAADARELRQLLHRARDIAAMLVDEGARHADEALRLLAEEAGALNAILQIP